MPKEDSFEDGFLIIDPGAFRNEEEYHLTSTIIKKDPHAIIYCGDAVEGHFWDTG